MADRVLLLGDPKLRRECTVVDNVADPRFQDEARRLVATLEEFREKHGLGRGIAAPQIGIAKRFICVKLDEGMRTLINPKVTAHSGESFTMWDDCMCFPHLLVKVRRSTSITVEYLDEVGQPHTWSKMSRAESELLQHEIDHLDGILAIDRADSREGVVYREVFDANTEYFETLVDYVVARPG